MRKTLLALAVLGAFAGVASAQSSVTLYGTVDVSGKYVKNDGAPRRLSLSTDGINSSQVVFAGKEDLGDGLYAAFHLNASISPDTGAVGAGNGVTSPTRFFNRRSTVSLGGNFGEIRLGRDYTPTFWNQTLYDAFGSLGVGSDLNVGQMPSNTFVRADNSVGYFLPSKMGGFYGQVMVAAGEGGNVAQGNAGRYIGGRVGFAAGPFDVAFAAGTQTNSAFAGSDQKTYNLGGAYDFGLLKLMGFIDRETAASVRETRGGVSAIIRIGQGEAHVGYDRSTLHNSVVPAASFTNTVWQAKAGYIHHMSKRTALYTTVSQLTNGDNSRLSTASGTAVSAAPTAGGKSTGFELGVRHFF